MSTTVQTASPLIGEKLYQVRARAALPLLVRQATAAEPIFYSSLAEELGMPNPRNLNYVLGSIGQAMVSLSNQWSNKIPPIQCLVLNKATGMPGEGIDWFSITNENVRNLPLWRRREIVQTELQNIYAYQHWSEVLAGLGLQSANTDFTAKIVQASSNFGGGEGPEHLRLKEYVANNPNVIGLSRTMHVGDTEYRLPSGDCVDVSFKSNKVWVAAEIKSCISGEADLTRGIFQCVKYKAILDAVLLSESKNLDVRAVLVLEKTLPESLRPLCNLLGIEVVDGVCPQ